MSQHARIEEVSDSDLDSDPSEQDPSDFSPALIRPSTSSSFNPPTSPPFRPPPVLQPQFRAAPSASENNQHKRYQCLYPLYFDANRTRAQGRRVGHELAVPNPLAREIVEAVQLLGLDTVFEPGKVHPKDWSNPGRVRVLIKEGGRVRNRGVKNSMLCVFCVVLWVWSSSWIWRFSLSVSPVFMLGFPSYTHCFNIIHSALLRSLLISNKLSPPNWFSSQQNTTSTLSSPNTSSRTQPPPNPLFASASTACPPPQRPSPPPLFPADGK